MKKQLFAFAIMMAAFGSVNAQSTTNSASATSKAYATVVATYRVENKRELNFGSFSVIEAGTVKVDPTLASERSKTGGVTLIGSDMTSAAFDLYGADNVAYTVNLPSGALTLTRKDGTETMTADNFTSSAVSGATLDAEGKGKLYVGATLNVGANQRAGIYESNDAFTVTVNYN